MKAVIVPNELRDLINARLDEAIAACPDAAKDREALYMDLLAFYDKNGYVPSFSLTRMTLVDCF